MWKKLDREVLEIPDENAYGFVYLIQFSDGMSYIGKKNFHTLRKRKFGKKELALITDKRLKKYEVVKKESNWKTYNSSNRQVLDRIAKGDEYSKIILGYATCKKHLTFLEEYFLHTNLTIVSNLFYNDNISGKFFRKEVEEWVQTKESD